MRYELRVNQDVFKRYQIYKVFDNGETLMWVAFMTHRQAMQFLRGK